MSCALHRRRTQHAAQGLLPRLWPWTARRHLRLTPQRACTNPSTGGGTEEGDAAPAGEAPAAPQRVCRITTPAGSSSGAMELTFFESFDCSPINYHSQLLEEAHKKHLVKTNVPPQLPPKIDPPNVPQPILCEELRRFLASITLEYAPTHDPPPLRTTGVGNVLLDAMSQDQLQEHLAAQIAADRRVSGGAPSTDAAATAAEADYEVEVVMVVEQEVEIEEEIDADVATAAAPGGGDTPAAVDESKASAAAPDMATVRRAAVERDKKFHCSKCGKAFRLKLAAQHHMTMKHPEGDADVLDGPGPGEILDEGGGGAAAAAAAGSGGAGAARLQRAAGATAPGRGVSASVGSTLRSKTRVKKIVKKLVERRMVMLNSVALATPGAKILGKKKAVALSAAGTKTGGPDAAGGASASAGGAVAAQKPTSSSSQPEAALPTEGEIRELLQDVWDVYGKKQLGDAFVAAADIVLGLADRRRPVDPDAPVKEAISATPLNARRPDKKPTTTTRPDKVVPIAVLSARFPNPFGDSAYLGDEDDASLNVNPFLPPEQQQQMGDASTDPHPGNATAAPAAAAAAAALAAAAAAAKSRGPPTVATVETSKVPLPTLRAAAQLRPLRCSICGTEFRILDGLRAHYRKVHKMEIPAEELRRARAALRPGQRYGIDSPDDAKGSRAAAATAATSSTVADAEQAGVAASDAGETGRPPGVPSMRTAIPAPEVAVHIRAATNIVLLGIVREVTEGFVKADPVTQLIISVSDSSGSSGGGDDTGAAAGAGDDVELVTVRVFGNALKPALREAKTGTAVMVSGTLKLNRRIDAASKRSHAYPFVQVTSPYGTLQVVEQSWATTAGTSAAP